MTESTDTKIAVLQNQMQNIEDKMDEGFKSINEKIDKLASTKSDLWVENAVKMIGTVVTVAIVGAIMGLILIK